jgi:hypothetical protein
LKKLHNEELHNLYASPNIIKHVGCMGEMKDADKVSVRKPDRKRQLRRLRQRGEDSNRMNLGEIEWEGVRRMHGAEDRDQWQALMNTTMNSGFHKRVGIS